MLQTLTVPSLQDNTIIKAISRSLNNRPEVDGPLAKKHLEWLEISPVQPRQQSSKSFPGTWRNIPDHRATGLLSPSTTPDSKSLCLREALLDCDLGPSRPAATASNCRELPG